MTMVDKQVHQSRVPRARGAPSDVGSPLSRRATVRKPSCGPTRGFCIDRGKKGSTHSVALCGRSRRSGARANTRHRGEPNAAAIPNEAREILRLDVCSPRSRIALLASSAAGRGPGVTPFARCSPEFSNALTGAQLRGCPA